MRAKTANNAKIAKIAKFAIFCEVPLFMIKNEVLNHIPLK